MTDKPEAWTTYPTGPDGIKVTGTVGFPHPYCITPKHLADEDGMYLDAERIRRAEKRGAKCDICRENVKGDWNKRRQEKVLSYDEHELGLAITFPGMNQLELNAKLKDGWAALHPSVQPWLLEIKPLMEKDGYKGVALKAGG